MHGPSSRTWICACLYPIGHTFQHRFNRNFCITSAKQPHGIVNRIKPGRMRSPFVEPDAGCGSTDWKGIMSGCRAEDLGLDALSADCSVTGRRLFAWKWALPPEEIRLSR
jgi:hypothetical protein